MSKEDNFKQLFGIIKHYNSPNVATTVDGYTVKREKALWIEPCELFPVGAFVPCAEYDNHFIFEEPSGKRGRPSYMCSCGGPAVIPKYSGYKRDSSSNVGFMFVCHFHASTNRHAEGSA